MSQQAPYQNVEPGFDPNGPFTNQHQQIPFAGPAYPEPPIELKLSERMQKRLGVSSMSTTRTVETKIDILPRSRLVMAMLGVSVVSGVTGWLAGPAIAAGTLGHLPINQNVPAHVATDAQGKG